MTNQNLETASEDLRYIRDAVGRRGEEPMPMYSRIMWGLYALIGFALLDFRPHFGGNFLLLGFFVCFALEFVFGALFGPRDKEKNKDLSLKSLSHAIAFMLAIAATVALAYAGIFQRGYSMGQMIMVLTGYHFITCGLLYPPKFELKGNGAFVVGVLALVAAVLVSFVSHGVWTGIGIVMAFVFFRGFQLGKTPVQTHDLAA